MPRAGWRQPIRIPGQQVEVVADRFAVPDVGEDQRGLVGRSALVGCSSRTVWRWKGRFEQGGVEALLGLPKRPGVFFGARWAQLAAHWVTRTTPRAFGFLRSR
jgi:hypothetical protein